MRSFLPVSLSTLLTLTLLRGAQAESITLPEPETATPATQQQVHKLLAGLPLHFIANQGQADAQLKYSLQGRDTQVYFTAKGLTLVLTEPEKKEAPRREASLKAMPQVSEPRPRWVTKLDFVGARRNVQLEGVERSEAVVSYFKGNEDQWKTELPTYHKLVYREVWPGIDVEYSGTGQKLKTTFIVKPGADPKRIRLAYRGVTKLALAENGQLNVHTPGQILTEDRPYSYQEINGKREEVRSAYRLRRHGSRSTHGFQYEFEVGKYDHRQPLIIDPVLVVYAGYIGGSKNVLNGIFGDDNGRGITVDNAGNAYVVGSTNSDQTTFPDGDGFGPLPGPDRSYNGSYDAFVVKVRVDGTGLVYAGYIGGSNNDFGSGIAVDSAGNAYVAGWTNANHLPTQGKFPVKIGPDLSFNGGEDAFIAKIRADGTSLVYAGYIGGNNIDQGRGITVDVAGNAYVTGKTESTQTTFPDGDEFGTLSGPDVSYNGGLYEAFVAKVRADGGTGIAVDNAGNAFVAEGTTSTQVTFPERTGPDLTYNGGTYEGDAFVAKIGGLPLTGIGVFRTTKPNVGRWYLDANRDGLLNVCTVDKCLGPFGASTDIPVVGRWNGAENFRLGTFTPATRVWRLDLNGNGVWHGVPTDRQVVFGVAGDLPVVGDWTNNGICRIGVFRRSNGMWYLDKDNDGLLEACTIDICQGPFGGSGDRAVVGDWSGTGKSKIGVYRASINRWYIGYNGDGKWSGVPTDKLWALGLATDQQVVGDWTGDGRAKIGVFRPSTGIWYLDTNGNGVWNAGDLIRGPFGLATDKAVVGAW